jgi:transposase
MSDEPSAQLKKARSKKPKNPNLRCKAYKFRLYPTKKQIGTLEWTLRRCQKLYNAALQERRDAYRLCGVSVSYEMQADQLPEIKRLREEYQDIHSQVQQDVLKRLDKAFDAFFRRVNNGQTPGYPRFKSGDRYDSFTYAGLCGLNKSILDAGWGAFITMCCNKAEEAGCTVVKVAPHGTSQACSGCEGIVEKDLNVRWHSCPHCGTELDRDHNAAKNILHRFRSNEPMGQEVFHTSHGGDVPPVGLCRNLWL